PRDALVSRTRRRADHSVDDAAGAIYGDRLRIDKGQAEEPCMTAPGSHLRYIRDQEHQPGIADCDEDDEIRGKHQSVRTGLSRPAAVGLSGPSPVTRSGSSPASASASLK